MVPQLKDIE